MSAHNRERRRTPFDPGPAAAPKPAPPAAAVPQASALTEVPLSGLEPAFARLLLQFLRYYLAGHDPHVFGLLAADVSREELWARAAAGDLLRTPARFAAPAPGPPFVALRLGEMAPALQAALNDLAGLRSVLLDADPTLEDVPAGEAPATRLVMEFLLRRAEREESSDRAG